MQSRKSSVFLFLIISGIVVALPLLWRRTFQAAQPIVVPAQQVSMQTVGKLLQNSGATYTNLKLFGCTGNQLLLSYWYDIGDPQSHPNHSDLHELIGMQSLTSDTFQELRSSVNDPISCPDPFLFDAQMLFTFPVDDSIANFQILNLTSKQCFSLIQTEVSSQYIGYAKVDSDTSAFLTNNNGIQTILVYNRANGTLREIYCSVRAKQEEDITAIEGYEGKIYLLLRRGVANYIRCITTTGGVEWEQNIGLKAYEQPDFNADELYIPSADTFFIKWYYCAEEPYFCALKKEGANFKPLAYPGNAPCRLLNRTPTTGGWLLFSTFPEFLFDDSAPDVPTHRVGNQVVGYQISTGIWRPICLDLAEDIYDLTANENGDVVTQTNMSGNDGSIMVFHCQNALNDQT